MTPHRSLRAAVLLIAALVLPARAADEIVVQTMVSQTALWVGATVTYTVTLTCQPGVSVLEEDLGADKLILRGLQVVGHALGRQVAGDGRTEYTIAYQLTTFEPGADDVGVDDWTVRYIVGETDRRGSAPAQDLRVPGAALAWRSALPAALNTLDIRDRRLPQPAPAWWNGTRTAGLALIGVSVAMFGWLVAVRLTAGRPRRQKSRRATRESVRDLRDALKTLRDADVTTASGRQAAYGSLEAVLRRHAGQATELPALALTPAEMRERLPSGAAPFAADELSRLVSECQRARYQPLDRLPDAQHFREAVDAASALFKVA